VWSRHSLLVTFHNEAWGGEKFFQLLSRLAQNPQEHLDLLELQNVCLALGFEGAIASSTTAAPSSRRCGSGSRRSCAPRAASSRARSRRTGAATRTPAGGAPRGCRSGRGADRRADRAGLYAWFARGLGIASDGPYTLPGHPDPGDPGRRTARPAPPRLAQFLEPERKAGWSTSTTSPTAASSRCAATALRSRVRHVKPAYLPVLQRIAEALNAVSARLSSSATPTISRSEPSASRRTGTSRANRRRRSASSSSNGSQRTGAFAPRGVPTPTRSRRTTPPRTVRATAGRDRAAAPAGGAGPTAEPAAMSRLRNLFTSRTFWVFLGLVALALLIWYVGPLVAIADYRPLESVRARTIAIAAVFLLWLLVLLVRWWRAKDINARLLSQLAKAQPAPGGKTARTRSRAPPRFESAVAVLKKTRLKRREAGCSRASPASTSTSSPGTCSSAPGLGQDDRAGQLGARVPARRAVRQGGDPRHRCTATATVVHQRRGAAGHRRPLRDAGEQRGGRPRRVGGLRRLLKRYRPRQR